MCFHRSVPAALGAVVSLACLAWPSAARADSMTIKYPGQHVRYTFELEPEAVFVFDRPLSDGPGLGVRGTVSLADGFVPSINNTVGITFGLDKDPFFKGNSWNLPVALQWNFWLTPHWSVMGEPGFFFQLNDNTKGYFQIWGGARYLFNQSVSLTFRVTLPNAPAFSLGPSFFF